MKTAVLIFAIVATAAIARCDDDIGSGQTTFALQPISDSNLRPTPTSGIEPSLWNESTDTTARLQLTSGVANESLPEETIVPAEDSPQPDTASPSKDVAGHEPYFTLDSDPATDSLALPATTDNGTNELFVRLAIWTVIILCLCMLTLLALRHWQRRQGILPADGGRSRVLETLAIGPGRAVSLIQLGDVRAIVGTDSSGINTIVLAPPAFDETLSDFDEETDESAPLGAA